MPERRSAQGAIQTRRRVSGLQRSDVPGLVLEDHWRSGAGGVRHQVLAGNVGWQVVQEGRGTARNCTRQSRSRWRRAARTCAGGCAAAAERSAETPAGHASEESTRYPGSHKERAATTESIAAGRRKGVGIARRASSEHGWPGPPKARSGADTKQ